MKKSLLIAAAALLFCSFPVFAQQKGNNDQDWREKFKAEKIAYLSSELNLTSAQAEKFWAVYNEIQAEKMAAQNAVMESYKALEEAVESGKASEATLSVLLEKYNAAVVRRHAVSDSATERFLKVLPAGKVAKYYVAEEKFRREQIHRLHKGK